MVLRELIKDSCLGTRARYDTSRHDKERIYGLKQENRANIARNHTHTRAVCAHTVLRDIFPHFRCKQWTMPSASETAKVAIATARGIRQLLPPARWVAGFDLQHNPHPHGIAESSI